MFEVKEKASAYTAAEGVTDWQGDIVAIHLLLQHHTVCYDESKIKLSCFIDLSFWFLRLNHMRILANLLQVGAVLAER